MAQPSLHTETARSFVNSALLALVAGAIAMGASPIFVRLAETGPFASAFWRVFLALPLLWAWDRWEQKREGMPVPLVKAARNPALILAGLLFAGDLFFWHFSITHTSVANATFFATTAPVWVVLATWLMGAEIIGRRTLAGLALACGGGALLVAESFELAPGRILGDLYGAVTAIFFAGYFLAVRAARQTAGAARIMFVSSCITAAVLGAVALILEASLWPASMQGVLALVALALLSHAGGQGLLAFALGHLPATFSSLVIFLEAFAAAGLGWLVLGEGLSIFQLAGGLIILAAVAIARPRNH
ncbi:DMT family transporter [Terrihabitans sp. B22-R8]|uniref:DMT family transporter n=1 Tax=Terrihabitans sp. B22-R8 TaxID=3425128 RepID=UPI00403D1D83